MSLTAENGRTWLWALPRTLDTLRGLARGRNGSRSFLPSNFNLSTVRSLGPFSTVGEGCISLVTEVEPRPLHPAEATALVGPLPRETRCF